MSTKLALHFQTIPPWAKDLVASSAFRWVKVIDPSPRDNVFPGQLTIGRYWIGGDGVEREYIMQGAQGAREYFQLLLPRYMETSYVDVIEGPNEPHPLHDYDFRMLLSEFTIEWASLVHGRLNRAVGGGCFSVGWPAIGTAADFGPMTQAIDFLLAHEYSARRMARDVGFLCLRYRNTVRELNEAGYETPNILITECGIDGGTLDPPMGQDAGWRNQTPPVSEDEYLQDLIWYDSEIQKDSYVKAATIFTSGPNNDWRTFDVYESLARRIDDYAKTLPPIPPVPPTKAEIIVVVHREMQQHVIPQNPNAYFYQYGREREWEPISGEWVIMVGPQGVLSQVWYTPDDDMQHTICARVTDEGEPTDEHGNPTSWQDATWHFDAPN